MSDHGQTDADPEAAGRLAALEGAGCDVFPVGRMWVVYSGDTLLSSAPTRDAAVTAAFLARQTTEEDGR